jgi:hypothetical protein
MAISSFDSKGLRPSRRRALLRRKHSAQRVEGVVRTVLGCGVDESKHQRRQQRETQIECAVQERGNNSPEARGFLSDAMSASPGADFAPSVVANSATAKSCLLDATGVTTHPDAGQLLLVPVDVPPPKPEDSGLQAFAETRAVVHPVPTSSSEHPEAVRIPSWLSHAQNTFSEDTDAHAKSGVAKYQHEQEELVGKYLAAAQRRHSLTADTAVVSSGDCGDTAHSRLIACTVNFCFLANLVLFLSNVFVAVWSGSLAVVASALDCALDLLSSAIIFCTARKQV